MNKTLLSFAAVICLTQVGCGGSDHTVRTPTLLTATVEFPADAGPDTPPAQALAAARPSSSSFGSGVARTYQQQRERLQFLATEQKRESRKARKSKSSGFFSSLLGTGNARSSQARYRRPKTKNNISSLNGLFGRRKGRRR